MSMSGVFARATVRPAAHKQPSLVQTEVRNATCLHVIVGTVVGVGDYYRVTGWGNS